MRRPRFALMFTIMAPIGWTRIRGQSDTVSNVWLRYISWGYWTVFITSIVRLSRLRAQTGKKWEKKFLIFTCHSFISSGSMREIQKKWATDILILEESGCDFFYFHVWGFLELRWVVHIQYYWRLQITDGDSGLVTVLILEDCCDQCRLMRVLFDYIIVFRSRGVWVVFSPWDKRLGAGKTDSGMGHWRLRPGWCFFDWWLGWDR